MSIFAIIMFVIYVKRVLHESHVNRTLVLCFSVPFLFNEIQKSNIFHKYHMCILLKDGPIVEDVKRLYSKKLSQPTSLISTYLSFQAYVL